MATQVNQLIEPFVRRGLFDSPEQAITEMARSYIIQHITRYQSTIERLQAKHGMTYEQFDAYLKSRSQTLVSRPDPDLNKAIMNEEEDALNWKISREMLDSWLGLETESIK